MHIGRPTPLKALRLVSAIFGAALLAVSVFVGYQIWPDTLKIARYSGASVDYRLPPPNPARQEVEIKLITTGHADVREAMIFRGGGLLTSHRQVFSGVLIRHPRATFLFEGGVGSQIQDEFRRNFNFWQRQLFAFVPEEPLLAQLASAGIDPGTIGFLILTHLHFDHAGVIRDFPGAKVRITREEYDGALQAAAEGKLGYFREQFGDPAINWDFVQFNGAGFGPFTRSLDLFGDGSIVLVPLPGHTAGGLGMFVTLESGERYFFIGDVSWSAKAIMFPSERTPFARDKVDSSPETVRKMLVFIHELWLNNPGLHIMPAHDFESLRSIPPLIGPAHAQLGKSFARWQAGTMGCTGVKRAQRIVARGT